MAIDQHLLEVLACIQCKGPLVMIEGGRGLLCEKCHLKFPVRDEVPILLLEETLDLAHKGGSAPVTGGPMQAKVAESQATTTFEVGGHPPVRFSVKAGPKKGMHFELALGTCKAIGRATSDPQKTASFHVDVTLSLDDNTRKLIHQYVQKQFRRAASPPGTEFGFRRTGDIVLEDVSVSRLHAMFFFDDVGVGVLDLVSKNGTYVNGDEVESRLLQRGDTVELGESKICFEG